MPGPDPGLIRSQAGRVVAAEGGAVAGLSGHGTWRLARRPDPPGDRRPAARIWDSWTAKLPRFADQDLARYMAEVATAMDDRQRRIGKHAAQEERRRCGPPRLSTKSIGPTSLPCAASRRLTRQGRRQAKGQCGRQDRARGALDQRFDRGRPARAWWASAIGTAARAAVECGPHDNQADLDETRNRRHDS